MLDDQTVTYTLAAVAVLVVGVVYYNQRMAGRERAVGAAAEEGPAKSDLLVRFARHEGSVVGETVAVDGDRLILKQAGVFKAVPLAAAKVVGDDVVLTGDVDWAAAIEAGSAWHEAHTRGHDPQVTEQLTRSEDVRKPALEALREREDDEEGAAADDSEE